MRAATHVVLRRDLSLNRRLYAWLLGPDDARASAYLATWGLDLLSETLCAQMTEQDKFEPRPFRIFVSLLDKWEIGAPLAERAVLPALRALASTEGEDARIAGAALLEAAEPRVVFAAKSIRSPNRSRKASTC